MSRKISSPGRLLALLVGSIFATEFMLMMLLRKCPTLSENEKALADALILIVVLSPALYFFFSLPIQREMETRVLAEDELRQKNRELDAFAENVAHSLKSSLHPIVGSAWFLRNKYGTRLEEADAALLTLIEQSGRNLSATIEDLLSLSRLRDRAVPVEAVDAGDVVHEILMKLPDDLIAAGNTVSVGALPQAYIPRTLLAVALDNLIENALRYGKNGSGPVEIFGEVEAGAIRLFVRDHGIGVPEDEQDRIFDVLYRGIRCRHLPGSGVGLALVRKIARLYGGRVSVDETPGGGATFCLQFSDIRYAHGQSAYRRQSSPKNPGTAHLVR